MLILTRRPGESILIGDPANPIARVKLLDIGMGRVRLGVDADCMVPVHRQEVADAIVDQMHSAKSATS